jgi:hypothetical protein
MKKQSVNAGRINKPGRWLVQEVFRDTEGVSENVDGTVG